MYIEVSKEGPEAEESASEAAPQPAPNNVVCLLFLKKYTQIFRYIFI